MVIRRLSYQVREIVYEIIIVKRQIINKLKITSLTPFMFAFMLKANTGRGRDICTTKIEIAFEEICFLYPKRIRKLFASLDLDRKGLEMVKTAVKQNDWSSACEALIAYYREGKTAPWLRRHAVESSVAIDPWIEPILKDTFTFQLVTGKIPRCQNGLLDWAHKGPKNDKEWAWFLNRHYHLLDLFAAYQKTGNLSYIRCINNHITDWIISSPSKTSPKTWAQWRGLETAYRIVHWAPLFYGLQQAEEFSLATRILMLSSILDHAYYLRHFDSWGANWVSREMNALATAALCWPEFKNSKQWLDYAIARMLHAINEQVYPDGVHKELTSHYHWITLRDFQNLANLLEISGSSVSAAFKVSLEQMWNYLAYSMRPDGHSVLNNDSDRQYNRLLVSKAALSYQRADWTYIATNGKAGQKPEGEPSTVFPWAGQVVMRSGWDAEAHWAFFDVGPLGINYHIHNDKLHLSIAAYGRDLLVDSGRYSYVRDKFWKYFRGSSSHNVILIDGKGQKGDVKEWHQPMTGNYAIEPSFDFARSTFDRGFIGLKGKASHSRAIVYLRGRYWIVVDRIGTDHFRKIESLWHFHPDCTVVVEGESVSSIDSGVGNLRIIPVSNLSWEVQIIQGQEDPIQGWWSREYNHKVPNPTAVYSTDIEESAIFA